jgi:NAD(P)-dependent dehydrogenase (short-subunit alcohol dehydrogenase family)
MKTVIITGANGNLGSAVTQTFLSKGYQVVATVFEEKMLVDFAAHPNLDVRVVNLSDEEATSRFIASVIEKYKTVDAALLLVGGFAMGNLVGTAVADIDKQISLNFKTAYHVTRPLFQHMLENGKRQVGLYRRKAGHRSVAGQRPGCLRLIKIAPVQTRRIHQRRSQRKKHNRHRCCALHTRYTAQPEKYAGYRPVCLGKTIRTRGNT